jgi:small subunit ribosomal protein S6
MANRLYELLIALDPAASGADADALLAKIRQQVLDAGGEPRSIEKPGIRKLAFKVRGRAEAHFFVLTLFIPATAVKQIEQGLRLQESVLRYMTTRLDESLLAAPEAPKAPVAPGAPASA